MDRCPECGASCAAGATACQACGAALAGELDVTRPYPAANAPAPADPGATTPRATGRGAHVAGTTASGSSAPADAASGPMEPGSWIGDRYRLIAPLGKGAMGSVWRATDVQLEQEVALKFLVSAPRDGGGGLELLRTEVRMARRVTHANVCRVHDLGEHRGQPFVSMEYVDGEDLGSLVRRIGAPSSGKAAQLAGQICAGLAAAHGEGVLHRDLKPANIMVDGAGNARIMDFGIAAVVEGDGGAAAAGSPAYMAPELFTGGQATVQSDLYSLGLVLHELFTGRPVFDASTMTELLEQHRRPLVPPTENRPDLDPAVDDVLRRCLERDPARRPRSALAVRALLPGGDPLAAALASGETPSIEAVAEAGDSSVLPPASALLHVAVLVALVVASVFLAPRLHLVTACELPRSPAVLADRAAEIVADLGLADPAADTTHSFDLYEEFLVGILENDTTPDRWDRLGLVRPSAIDFWYRQSPEPLVAGGLEFRVGWNDPPHDVPGMVGVRTDPRGQLRELRVVPRDEGGPQRTRGEAAPDWNEVFALAGLDAPATFTEVAPRRVPHVFADARHAWRGRYPEPPGLAIRVEAATLGGQLVEFRILEEEAAMAGGATRPRDDVLLDSPLRRRLEAGLDVFTVLGALGLLLWSWRKDRIHWRSANRLGLFALGAGFVTELLRADHTLDAFAEVGLLLRVLAASLLVASYFWIFYAALEPPVRRIWPETLITWTRLLGGRHRDPMVGKSLLGGCIVGMAVLVVVDLHALAIRFAGHAPGVPRYVPEATVGLLADLRQGLGGLLSTAIEYVAIPVSVLMLLVLLRLVLRHRKWSVVAFCVLQTPVWALRDVVVWWSWPVFLGLTVLMTYLLVSRGLLALITAAVVFGVGSAVPFSLDPGRWYADVSWIVALGILALGGFGAWRASRGPR